MSWQGYIDNLMSTKQLTAVGIFGLDGSTWASSPNFPLSTENIKQIMNSFSDQSKIQASGLQAGADRYIYVRGDSNTLMLKKGGNGIVSQKSQQCAIIALHDGSIKAEIASTSIGKVIDYLSKHGY